MEIWLRWMVADLLKARLALMIVSRELETNSLSWDILVICLGMMIEEWMVGLLEILIRFGWC